MHYELKVASSKNSIKDSDETDRVPRPSHRHASPSAPWPWVDLGDGRKHTIYSSLILILYLEVDKAQLDSTLPPIPKACDHKTCHGGCYGGYPQSLFPNWTEQQVKKSGIFRAIKDNDPSKKCKLYRVNVDSTGFFTKGGEVEARRGNEAEIWETLIKGSDQVRRPLLVVHTG